VVALTNLRELYLGWVRYNSAGMASLARLTSLQYACFQECYLPSSLPERLRVLEILDPYGESADMAATLDSALRQLTQLTGLSLKGLPPELAAPPSLAALSSLQWLQSKPRIRAGKRLTAPLNPAPETVLPLGPWQRSLRHLATSFWLAQHSLPFLRGAERLQRLSILEPTAKEPGMLEHLLWNAVWDWAARHASLQHIECVGEIEERKVSEALQQLQNRRPALHIGPGLTYSTLLKELYDEWL
jgi:hypothetical protein